MPIRRDDPHVIVKASATTAALVFLAVSMAPPAAAAQRSSDACTHNFYGTNTTRPDVCIEIHGEGTWAERVVARWVNGSGQLDRWGVLHEGNGRSVHGDVRAHDAGRDLVAEWRDIRLEKGKACVSFTGLESWACQEVKP